MEKDKIIDKSTKIICTLGPAVATKELLGELMVKGMDIARLNFSHGTHEEHAARVAMIKEVREEVGKPVAIMLDTKGPEIRTGVLENGGKVTLVEGQTFTLTTEAIAGTNEKVSITYDTLYQDVVPGNTILIDDGLIGLTVKEIVGQDIVCEVVNGGELGQRKGINVPNVKVNLPGITEQDKKDILFGITQGFDYIAASFVRSAEVIWEIRELLDMNGGKGIGIIAKIENAEGVENIDEIIKVVDGVMVARGDLGVEIPASQVPHVQKQIIRKCNENFVPVITATQMLDSMIRNPRPTRAEVADVANAIYDGTDAIMLSGETAAGKYPIQAVKMMVEIAQTTEKLADYSNRRSHKSVGKQRSVSNAVGLSAVAAAEELGAKAIVTPTMGGKTAQLIAGYRPNMPIYAITPSPMVQHKLMLLWGVIPLMGTEETSTERIIQRAMFKVRSKKLVDKGDLIVFTAGDPATNMRSNEGAVTNMMHIIEAQ